eukprot:CAMPEP_0179432018 /NCGR_PEP_ID=MMETSP0799-20121207/16763_1 /TAXON_ID=46947 /ORGANISM="Geminigera cryophila, Strain CCMP2564" /LENGTH=112 /DNA_ID=CAMNT_0021209239 /DNA_START=452 /DNA_END=791 /DNA_ORIENTATION=-
MATEFVVCDDEPCEDSPLSEEPALLLDKTLGCVSPPQTRGDDSGSTLIIPSVQAALGTEKESSKARPGPVSSAAYNPKCSPSRPQPRRGVAQGGSRARYYYSPPFLSEMLPG